MRVGGENLLKRTDFSEVDISRNTIPEWTNYGKINVYNGYTPGEVPGQLMLVAKDSSETVRGIYQEISSSEIAKGTQVTLAFNLTLGSNASRKTSMYIDYYASGSLLSTTTITDEASGSSIGSVKRTFTTPDNGYDTIRVRLETGAPFSLSNHWITLRNLSLTRGNVAPAWAPNNVQVDYASKSELIQTAETLTSQISTKMESGEFSSRLQQSATDIQIGFNGINDYITIDPTNGIKVNHTDGSYTQISQNGFDRYVKGSRKKYKSLYTSGRYQLSGTGYYEDRTIVLPDEFNSAVESNFNFAAWITETHAGNTGNDSYIREFHASPGRMTWNGTNWQFTISAHILYYNSYQKKDEFSKGYVEWYVLV